MIGLFLLIAVFVLVIFTCCIAGLLMIIPYLGAVLLLPFSVFFRSLGPEFVRQFGGEFDLWEGEDRVYSPI